jgi:hypothetical protein
VLDARNAIIHSVVVVDQGDDGLVAKFWQPRSDKEHQPDADELNDQVRRMGALGARARRLGRAAAVWCKGHAPCAPTA